MGLATEGYFGLFCFIQRASPRICDLSLFRALTDFFVLYTGLRPEIMICALSGLGEGRNSLISKFSVHL